MMTRYWYVLLTVFAVSAIQGATTSEHLEDALEGNPIVFEHLLDTATQQVSHAEKQAMLHDLMLMGEEALAQHKKCSLLKNNLDLSMAVLGTTIGLYGAYRLMRYSSYLYMCFTHAFLPGKKVAAYWALSLAATAGGGYLGYKGLTYASQKEKIEDMRQIRNLLESRLKE